MFKKVYSAANIGINTQLVCIEVDVSYGMIQWNIVGLPDMAIKESKQRVSSAIKNSGIKLPERKITINLAPADIKKEGSSFDLAIAISILFASSVISCEQQIIDDILFLGELALDGTLYPVSGILPIASEAHIFNKKKIILPIENISEASIFSNLEVLGFHNLKEVIEYFQGLRTASSCVELLSNFSSLAEDEESLDFDEVAGQEKTKRAMQISAVGRHNILLLGSPGSGKSMMAKRLKTILPEMSQEEKIEVSKIYSIVGKIKGKGLIEKRPFRSPHHSISSAGLLGGTSYASPGEISFAHNGVLFLDELLEFKKSVLESLRQPLEDKKILISRAHASAEYPASFLLIAATNPCPCGFYGDIKRACICSSNSIKHYLSKLSGPLLDRIDLQVALTSISYDEAVKSDKGISSKELMKNINEALYFQKKRIKGPLIYNAYYSSKEIQDYCFLNSSCQDFFRNIFNTLNISMRMYHKLIKISRTIADLDFSEHIEVKHAQEAYQYRQLDAFLGL